MELEFTPTQLLYLVHRYHKERGHIGALHSLEQDTKIYFDLHYFKQSFISAEWDVCWKYFASFTSPQDSVDSTKVFFEISKQKYLTMLHRKDIVGAVKALKEELYPVLESQGKANVFREFASLVAYDDVT
eukprot:TRINITY_DN5654_c0_g1_i12.p1 TRINITY_DN5654_c0_g1~~TRINITY_DN5654_c0_g1_i12.p1  ORF type:complete len:142 (+),score=8.98 TRINITY_DN5654_c0_g1_i12:38-427(+)